MSNIIELTLEHLHNRVKDFPQPAQYFPQNERRTSHRNQHFGQRKLLMSEVQLLTNVYRSIPDKKTTLLVVYAGANPCDHLTVLIDAFPDVYYVLIDPAFKPNSHLKEWPVDRVAVCSECFDNRAATSVLNWRPNNNNVQTGRRHFIHNALDTLRFPDGWILDHAKNLLFVSDIRLNARNEQLIEQDMFDQEEWCRIIKPRAGLLKFRLPFVTPSFRNKYKEYNLKFPYMNGTVYLPIWGPRSTTECRLYVENSMLYEDVIYDPVKHEEMMAGFNSINRPQQYTYNNIQYESFDYAAEALVWSQFNHVMSADVDTLT
jgi:hypothetical protein